MKSTTRGLEDDVHGEMPGPITRRPARRPSQTMVDVPRAVTGVLQRIGRLATAQHVKAYAVGGCVRDWLFGIAATTDLDLIIEGRGIEFARRVATRLGGCIIVHEQFGTATVRVASLRIDVATCRRETYAKPAAYPRVTAGTLRDDLRRRDFTINAMAMGINPERFGTLIDPFHGARDVRQRLLRILHRRSFLDDPSRILRGVRFAQRFGCQWERHTQHALREAMRVGALGWLNTGRLRKELDRMLEEPSPRTCLRTLAGLLDPSPS